MALKFNSQKINELLKLGRIQKKEFYNRMGIVASTLLNWTSDNQSSTMKVEDLVKMCNIFKWPIDEFIYDPSINKQDSIDKESNAMKVISELNQNHTKELLNYEKRIGDINLEHEKEKSSIILENVKTIHKLEKEIERLKEDKTNYDLVADAQQEVYGK